MMKNRIIAAFILTIVGLGIHAQDFSAVNSEGKTLYYNIIKGTNNVEVTKDKKDKYAFSSIEIPSQVSYQGKTYTVTAIAKNAFYRIRGLREVVIPPTVEKIGDSAFGLTDLYSVILPEGVIEVGLGAFSGWTKEPRTLSLPNTLKVIGSMAFGSGPVNGSKGVYSIESLPSIINESNCGKYGIEKASVAAYYSGLYSRKKSQPQVISTQVSQPQQTIVQPAPQPAVVAQPKVPASDVDTDIPTVQGENGSTFAVIIANEHYQEEVDVEYALNDGETFRQYCQQVLGLPEKNIHLRKDATLNNIKAELAWVQQVAEAYDGQARFIVYYAGHGIPDEKSGTSYLLPVDGKGTMLETGYSLQDFYKLLGGMPSQGVTVFMDACFSGSKRGDGMLASARSVAIKAKAQAPQGKMVVFSAAQGDETAYPYKEKGHGLFTYYLLKKLKDSRGSASLEELGSYITEQVRRESIVSNGKSQTPSVSASGTMGDTWKKLKLK